MPSDNPPTHDDAESEAERESIQSAMNMVRACLFGDSANLSGAIKDEPTRLLIADKLNRLDAAIENGLNTAMRSGQRALTHERQLREEAEEKLRATDSLWRTDSDQLHRRIGSLADQLHEARTQLERAAKRAQREWETTAEWIRRAESAETQLERCQEAGKKLIDAIDGSVAKGSWTPPIRAALDEVRSTQPNQKSSSRKSVRRVRSGE